MQVSIEKLIENNHQILVVTPARPFVVPKMVDVAYVDENGNKAYEQGMVDSEHYIVEEILCQEPREGEERLGLFQAVKKDEDVFVWQTDRQSVKQEIAVEMDKRYILFIAQYDRGKNLFLGVAEHGGYILPISMKEEVKVAIKKYRNKK